MRARGRRKRREPLACRSGAREQTRPGAPSADIDTDATARGRGRKSFQRHVSTGPACASSQVESSPTPRDTRDRTTARSPLPPLAVSSAPVARPDSSRDVRRRLHPRARERIGRRAEDPIGDIRRASCRPPDDPGAFRGEARPAARRVGGDSRPLPPRCAPRGHRRRGRRRGRAPSRARRVRRRDRRGRRRGRRAGDVLDVLRRRRAPRGGQRCPPAQTSSDSCAATIPRRRASLVSPQARGAQGCSSASQEWCVQLSAMRRRRVLDSARIDAAHAACVGRVLA